MDKNSEGNLQASCQKTYTLPADFKISLDESLTDREAEDYQSLVMQANFLVDQKVNIAAVLNDKESQSKFVEIVNAVCLTSSKDLISLKHDIRAFLSHYNRKFRLATRSYQHYEKQWPLKELIDLEKKMNPKLLPMPSPVEYVDEEYCWSCFSSFENQKEWLGHGFFWRPQPVGDLQEIQNMGGAATSDFDCLEDRFCHLKKASIIFADYVLLQKDFPQIKGHTEKEIDEWLIENCAFFSIGQVQRIQTEFQKKLGIDKIPEGVSHYINTSKNTSGIRQKSGGRAANLFVDGKYSFDTCGFLKADILNVKGLGTHIRANHKDSEKLTGMLSLGDALRELALERLIHRIIEIEGVSDELDTVLTYAIIDTGLRYAEGEIDPASGSKDQLCVMTVRQRQSRAFVHYNGYNFSGSLLMTGEEDDPSPVMRHGMKNYRKILNKYGISAEMAPQTLFAKDLGVDITTDEFLDLSIQGIWNIQIDAAFTHLMDFSDYYVLPTSPLDSWWKMSIDTLFSALVLEGGRFKCKANGKEIFLEDCPRLLEFLCGTGDREKGKEAIEQRVDLLSKDERILNAQGISNSSKKLTTGMKPKYCMCWYFELDDSEMSIWSLDKAKGLRGAEILEIIETHLPKTKC